MSRTLERSMRDACPSAKRVMVARCEERRVRVSDELLCQRDSLWRWRGCFRKAPGQQAKFMRRCADGAAGERHGGGPLRRPVRIAHCGFQT
jgi:hypothetical protein